jgi:hypothetical protein
VVDEMPAKVEERRARPTSNWRELIKVHPAADVFPMLSERELLTLAAGIGEHGLQVPIVTWFDKDDVEWLIDGRNRLEALAKVGYLFKRVKITSVADFPTTQLQIIAPNNPPPPCATPSIAHYCEGIGYGPAGGSVANPYCLAELYNINRRHLTNEQKQALIEQLLKDAPECSDRAIAGKLKVDHKTVGAKRKKLEGSGEIPHKTERTEASGRMARGSKPNAEPAAKPTDAPSVKTEPAQRAKPPAAAPAAAQTKPPDAPKHTATEKRQEWIAQTAAELRRNFDGTVEAIGKLLGDCKAEADKLSDVRRAQLLAPIAKALAGPLAEFPGAVGLAERAENIAIGGAFQLSLDNTAVNRSTSEQ